jgi:hypothetical protein
MSHDEETRSLLQQVVANQRIALEVQREHLELARAQLERSNQQIKESLDLQRAAVAKQALLTRIVLPLIGVLCVLLVYLIVRWDIL